MWINQAREYAARAMRQVRDASLLKDTNRFYKDKR